MMSWGFPSIHAVVLFSSVLQVLFIILGSKPPYIHREVSQESLYKIWKGTNPTRSQKMSILYTSLAVKLKLTAILSMSRESP